MHIFEDNNQLWTTSKEIADILGKEHFTIMRDFKRKGFRNIKF